VPSSWNASCSQLVASLPDYNPSIISPSLAEAAQIREFCVALDSSGKKKTKPWQLSVSGPRTLCLLEKKEANKYIC
jgi:hypothetical protein